MEDNRIERAKNFLPRVDKADVTGNEVDRRLVSITAPASNAAEQYRTLYYRLERMRELRPMKVVAFTSAQAGEGKTVTAINLALTAARANADRSVLLLDADLRRCRVGPTLGIRSRPGLTEVLSGQVEIKEAVRRFQGTSLQILPAGTVPELAAEVLAGGAMKQLLKRLREAYDEIYVDMPPTLPFADAAILAMHTDGVVIVVRANQTNGRTVSQAMESLQGTPLVGCVLNAVEPAATPYTRAYLK